MRPYQEGSYLKNNNNKLFEWCILNYTNTKDKLTAQISSDCELFNQPDSLEFCIQFMDFNVVAKPGSGSC